MLIEDGTTVYRRPWTYDETLNLVEGARPTAARRFLLDQVGALGLWGVGGARLACLTMARRPDRCRPTGRDGRNVFA